MVPLSSLSIIKFAWYNCQQHSHHISLRDACPINYRWIFGKVPKGGGGVISDPKNFVAKFLAFETPIWGGHFRSKNFRSKKSLHFSQKRPGGGGPKAVWNFSKNSSIMVGTGFPHCHFRIWRHRANLDTCWHFQTMTMTMTMTQPWSAGELKFFMPGQFWTLAMSFGVFGHCRLGQTGWML